MLLPMKVYDPRNRLHEPALPGDAGYDIAADEDATVYPERITKIRTGVKIEIPAGFVGLIADKSGRALSGLKTLGGVIDAGFTGEIVVLMTSVTERVYDFDAGDKIAQLLIVPVATPALERVTDVSALSDTVRGAAGFGSTGVR